MKLSKQKLKQIIKEELEEAHGGAKGPFPGRYGDAHKKYDMEPTDTPPPSASEDSWPAAEDIEDAIQMLNAEVEDNGDQSGTLFHVINRLEVALDKLGELAPVKLSAPKEDPWKFKKRLGIGGSVHDRLGGPREKK
jgi:hypothetical protein